VARFCGKVHRIVISREKGGISGGAAKIGACPVYSPSMPPRSMHTRPVKRGGGGERIDKKGKIIVSTLTAHGLLAGHGPLSMELLINEEKKEASSSSSSSIERFKDEEEEENNDRATCGLEKLTSQTLVQQSYFWLLHREVGTDFAFRAEHVSQATHFWKPME
jgi:hypothetical protein